MKNLKKKRQNCRQQFWFCNRNLHLHLRMLEKGFYNGLQRTLHDAQETGMMIEGFFLVFFELIYFIIIVFIIFCREELQAKALEDEKAKAAPVVAKGKPTAAAS